MSFPNKKDIHNRVRTFNTALRNLENNNEINISNKELILDFIRDCRLGKTLKNRQKKSIGEARCLKYIQILKRLSFWFNKPFNEATQTDMEKIIEILENDKYVDFEKKQNETKSKFLSHSTKVDYKKTIRKFYKWLFGNNKHFPELVDWIDTYDIVKEIPALKREEIEKLANSSKIRDKAIIMFLFDSGARAEEFLNIRICDLTKNDDTYKVRIVYSKTKPRTIHLPIASKYIDLWLNEYNENDNSKYLFPISYEALRMMVHRIGKKILNKNVNPHLFRHSSATYYANLLNHQQLCYRYGWTMSSNMPNRYLDREGIFEEETSQIVKAKDLSAVEKQNQKLSEELASIRQSNEDLTLEINQIKNDYNKLLAGKDFIKLFSALSDKQNLISEVIKNFKKEKFDVVFNN